MWRPSYGWVGLVVIIVHFVVFPVTSFILLIYGVKVSNTIDVSAITALLTSVVAIATMRSYDKLKQIDTKDTNEDM